MTKLSCSFNFAVRFPSYYRTNVIPGKTNLIQMSSTLAPGQLGKHQDQRRHGDLPDVCRANWSACALLSVGGTAIARRASIVRQPRCLIIKRRFFAFGALLNKETLQQSAAFVLAHSACDLRTMVE